MNITIVFKGGRVRNHNFPLPGGSQMAEMEATDKTGKSVSYSYSSSDYVSEVIERFGQMKGGEWVYSREAKANYPTLTTHSVSTDYPELHIPTTDEMEEVPIFSRTPQLELGKVTVVKAAEVGDVAAIVVDGITVYEE